MRYPASEKLEIIRIVEQSHLPAKRTLDQLGIARRTFYRWYDRYLEGGPEALEDRPSAPSRVWNRIGRDIQDKIVEMALEETDLSPRELGSGPINRAFEASEWRTYRTKMRARKVGHLSKRIFVRDGSHSDVPSGFDQNGPSLRWIGSK